MPSTFSQSSGLTLAVSKTSITDVLSILPDNTSELISPRDVRDAIYSNWEHGGVLRWNTLSSKDYIGVAQNTIKDFKLLFGKKQLSGSDIMNTSLLNSDTDIFLYNTKSDTGSQDLKISFLSGNSSSLYLSAPYIEVQQVASPSSLNFNLTHNQASGGDFNFIAGLNGNITLNKFVLPTQIEFNSQISVPTSSVASDYFLTTDSSGNVSVKKAVGISGSITIASSLQVGSSSIFGGTQWGILFEDNSGKLQQSNDFLFNTSLNQLSVGSFSVTTGGTVSGNDFKVSQILYESGSNKTVGTVSLIAGSASVINSLVTTDSIIICTRQTYTTSVGHRPIQIEKFSGSFSIVTGALSGGNPDDATIGYLIINTF